MSERDAESVEVDNRLRECAIDDRGCGGIRVAVSDAGFTVAFTSARTSVVEFHANVPSASGASVGMVKALADTLLMAASGTAVPP